MVCMHGSTSGLAESASIAGSGKLGGMQACRKPRMKDNVHYREFDMGNSEDNT